MLSLANVPFGLLLWTVEASTFVISLCHDGSVREHGAMPCSLPDIPILYETDRLLAIDKPAGIPHHDTADEGQGILSVIRQKQEKGVFPYNGRLYGVHRLDRVTTGILLLAKDAKAARELTTAFKEGRVTKLYTGLSRHKPFKKKQGWVTGGMVKGRRKSWYLSRESRENFARTRFSTAGLGHLQEHCWLTEGPIKTLLLFRPCTGRTHQLRVAAKSVGLPLAGDPIYSDGFAERLPQTCLHATGLHVTMEDDDITIWSTPPFDQLWKNTTGFHDTFRAAVRRHVDCPPLLEKMMALQHTFY
jgi:tRNA pseudouridine32 synthase/23S rRNA pseudouridine746 synthase